MRRRVFLSTVGITGVLVVGCLEQVGIGTTPPVVDEEFSEPHEERVDVGAGETLRVEVTPQNPKYQLAMTITKEENLDEGGVVRTYRNHTDRYQNGKRSDS